MTDAATPETATAPEIHDLSSAARAIEKIIRRERPPAADGNGASATDAGGPDDQDDEIDTDAEDEPDNDPGVIDDDDDEEDEGAEQEPRYKVKAGGEEAEVTLEELIKGYQRGADYTKKTM